MRSWLAGVATFLIACGAHAQANSPVHVTVSAQGGDAPTWLGAAPAQARVVVGPGGETYVGVWIDVPQGQAAAQAVRAPVDLSLVIDTSGSMSGEKIANARMAATSVLETLADGDIVSIYAFSDAVAQIAPPTVLSHESRSGLMQAVSALQPMGSTNMYDGLRLGEAALTTAPPSHTVRRLVLISDGLANIGPSSPEQLGDLAGAGTESGAQVSAIGVGTDYDENTLGALAMRSSGRLYHLEQPSQMAEILRNEVNLLASTVGSDAYIELQAAPGVQVLGAEEAAAQNTANGLRVPIGSLHAGQHREMLVRVRLPAGDPGEHPLGSVRLVFRDPAGAHAEHEQAVPLRFAVTSDARAAAASANDRVQAMVTNYQVAQAQLRAVQMLNRGENQQAAAVLADAETQLNTAAAQTHDATERQRLRRAASSVAASHHAASASPPNRPARGAALQVNSNAYQMMME